MAYLKRADAYYEVGHFKAAIADATHVIRSQWDYSSSAYIIRGRAHFELGEVEQSAADFNTALELDPDAPTPISRGFTRAVQGTRKSALADYSAAIRVDPQFVGLRAAGEALSEARRLRTGSRGFH